jgi:hypothetical protein
MAQKPLTAAVIAQQLPEKFFERDLYVAAKPTPILASATFLLLDINLPHVSMLTQQGIALTGANTYNAYKVISL